MRELFCGIDVGTRASAICLINNEKKVVKRWQGSTSKVSEVLKDFGPKVHCVTESGPLAETICAAVEKHGATIEIVDSRHTKAILKGKKKTDRIDAQVLAELAQLGWYKPIHRKSGVNREQRSYLVARDQTVRSATRMKNCIRGLLKSHGIVLPKGTDGREFMRQVRDACNTLPYMLRDGVRGLLVCWIKLHRTQLRMYKMLDKMVKKNPTAKLLTSIPGVGAATAFGFVCTIATHTRFSKKKQVASYFGLAPRIHQSGDTNYNGRITKQGDSLMRFLLVEAAHSLLTRTRKPSPLREWGLKLAERKGMGKAKVAVARKLTELMFTMWQKNQPYMVASTN